MTATTPPIQRDHVIEVAREWLGTPYLHQASRKGVGADCLGLVRGVYGALYGVELEQPPPYTPDWAERRREETLYDAARRYLIPRNDLAFDKADILLFRMQPSAPMKHVAIATSEERMIHAFAGRCVCEGYVHSWWRRRLAAVFSFPGVTL